MEVKTPRDAIIDSCSPYAVLNSRAVMRHFDAHKDPITLLLVYSAIAAHVNKRTGLAHPSQERIGTAIGVHPKTVGRSIKKLIERGLLKLAYKKPMKRGHILVLRVVHDAALDYVDERSIASYPQSTQIGRHGVPSVAPSYPQQRPTDGTSSPIPGSTDRTSRCPLTDGTSSVSQELLEHKKTFNGQALKTAERVIEHWRACAWMHGEEHPVANEDDLATAHALTARGITADELEAAVLQAPESPRLAALVRDLLA